MKRLDLDDLPPKAAALLAGAQACEEVLLVGRTRWALMRELRGAPEPALPELLARLHDADLVLVEGFKQGEFPKLEVWRAAPGKPPLWGSWPGIRAVASDDPVPLSGLPAAPPPTLLALADTAALADFVLAHAARC